MAKITLDGIVSGFKSVAKLISNFDSIEDNLNNKVLYRDNPEGEPNQMEGELDMNSNRILNLPTATSASEPLTYGQYTSQSGVIQFDGTVVENQLGSEAVGNVFTLALTTYTPGLQNLSVYINGVRQLNSTYAETNSTQITFSTAPVATDEYTFVVNERAVDADSYLASSVTFTPLGTGAIVTSVQARLQQTVSVKDFGAVGDGVTDDTSAIQAALATGSKVIFPEGVYVCTDTLVLPDNCKIEGAGNPKIATFPQKVGDKGNLRPGFKDQISGSSILFTGSGTTNTTTTNRSDRFSSITPMVEYVGTTSLDISDIAFLQDMDVLDAGGTLTDGTTDNKTTDYSAGVFLASTTLSSFRNVTVFGYFDDAGLVMYSGSDLASSLNPDYNTFTDCLISGGTAILGHDTAAGAASQAFTGARFVGCGLYAADHHTRLDGDYTIPSLYIDGYITGSIGKIRGHSFIGCNIRTYANDAIVLDHADDIQFSSCVWELPSLSGGDSNSDASGGFVGSANTGDLWVFGGAGTSQPKITDFVSQTAGKWVFAGGGHFDGFMVGEGSHGVRLSGSNSDSNIQLTDDFSSAATGWSITRDTSQGDELDIKYEGTSKLTVDTTGAVKSPFGLKRSNQTISGGAITKSSSGGFIGVTAANPSEDLDTINGDAFEGEIIVLRAANTSNTVVCKDGTGNLRLAGDFSLDNSTDRITLMFDGTNWAEIARSNNGA